MGLLTTHSDRSFFMLRRFVLASLVGGSIALFFGSVYVSAIAASVSPLKHPGLSNSTFSPPAEPPKPDLYRGSGRRMKRLSASLCRRPGDRQTHLPKCPLTDLPGNRSGQLGAPRTDQARSQSATAWLAASQSTYHPPDNGGPDGTIGAGTR